MQIPNCDNLHGILSGFTTWQGPGSISIKITGDDKEDLVKKLQKLNFYAESTQKMKRTLWIWLTNSCFQGRAAMTFCTAHRSTPDTVNTFDKVLKFLFLTFQGNEIITAKNEAKIPRNSKTMFHQIRCSGEDVPRSCRFRPRTARAKRRRNPPHSKRQEDIHALCQQPAVIDSTGSSELLQFQRFNGKLRRRTHPGTGNGICRETCKSSEQHEI